MSAINNQGAEEEQLELPPGFRFHPTDEEVVSHYLIPKVLNCLFTCLVIADVDLNKCEPWDLPGKAKMGEKEWYFFCHKDRKYPTGMRTNRATATGYWKATGKDKEIFRGRDVLVGMKKTLVFYLGRAPRGEKTPWVMHEYRLEGKLPPNLSHAAAKDEWAVCRVFNKDLAAKPGQPTPSSSSPAGAGMEESSSSRALLEELLDLPDLTDFNGGAAAGTSSGYHQVKTENAPPPLQVQDQYSYFSLPVPAATNNTPQGADHHLSAIRRHCKAEASTSAAADMGVGSSSKLPPPLYPELFDDLCPDGFTDYSNMLKF